jgi:hypothetical protein
MLIVYPFTHLFPVFLGIKLYMALVPALIVIPAYLYLRESSLGRPLSIVGGLLTASLATYSQMAVWNAGVNLLAISFLLLALTFLTRALRTGTLLNCGVTGFFVGLIGATHQLTLTATVLAFAVSFGLYIAFASDHLKVRLKRVLIVVAYSVIFLIPVFPLYRYFLSQQANLGVGDYTSRLQSAYLSFEFYAWSGHGVQWDLVVFAGVLVTMLGLATVVVEPIDPKDRSFFLTLSGIASAALILPLLQAASAVRGLYYLPIACVALSMFFFKNLNRYLDLLLSTPRIERRLRRYTTGKRNRATMLTAVALSVLFVAGAVQYSDQSMTSAIHFYSELSPSAVSTLNWIRSETPTQSVLFDGANLAPWILGYAERAADAPSPLALEATQKSYEIAKESNEISEGNYFAADSYLTIGNNFPDALGSPTVFIYSPGQWLNLLESQVGFVYEHVGLTTSVYNLGGALLQTEPTCGMAGDSIDCAYAIGWPHSSFTATEQINITGQVAQITWLGPGASTLAVNLTWRAPPSGYIVDYLRLSNPNATSVVDEMTLSGQSESLGVNAASVNQSVDPSTGWITLRTNGSTVRFSFGGLLDSHDGPVSIDTSTVVGSLGIDYFVVNEETHYALYTRLHTGVYGPYSLRPVFDCGEIWVFQVDPPEAVVPSSC